MKEQENEKSIINALKAKESLLAGKGTTQDQIDIAEKELGLAFASDYRAYLFSYGIAAFDGHELTGISKSERLNVVSATLAARKDYANIASDLYVVENTGYEGIIILQNAKGEIFGCGINTKLEKLCDSLADYVNGKY